MHLKKRVVTFLLAMLASLSLQAAEVTLTPALEKTLEGVFGGKPDQVSEAPIEGMLEVSYGMNLFYVTPDGQYLINGEVFDLNSRRNLTKERRSSARNEIMETLDESDMIIYKASDKEEHVVTVFTDIDCVFCRKLHKGMAEMNDLGITVRYVAFPRAGFNSPSYYKAVSVWCAEDRNQAMDDAKNRDKVIDKRCEDAPVKAQMELGKSIGVSGTPAIVLSDGTLQPGYLPPKNLKAMLDKAAK